MFRRASFILGMVSFLKMTLAFAQPIHLTNVPEEPASTAPSSTSIFPKGEIPETSKSWSVDDPEVEAAFLKIDDMLLVNHASDPFFKTKVRLFSRLGPKLVNSSIPPAYWPETVDFAYTALSAQTQHMLKALQQMENRVRADYEREMARHRSNPRFYREPVLNLEPIYWLRRQLIELSSP